MLRCVSFRRNLSHKPSFSGVTYKTPSSSITSNFKFQTVNNTPVLRFTSNFALTPEQIQERVINVVKNFEKVDPEKVNPDAHFVNDLGLDSLDTVELVLAVEDEFSIEIPDEAADEISSIKKAVAFLVTQSSIK